jgi:hypothetical protein
MFEGHSFLEGTQSGINEAAYDGAYEPLALSARNGGMTHME